MSCTDLLLVIVAVFFPPIPVAIRRGLCSADFFINVALCCLGYLPGLIHAFYIISKYPGDEHGCRHGYVAVNSGEQTFYGSSDLERAAPSSSQQQQQQPQQQAPPSGDYYTSLDNKKDNTNRPPPYSG
ncbi:Plasma membrane proteolipid 3 [Yarrowia sp. B02]|nr:Plasma membrane proteolipid 3 [Yarrowia sp. B02]